MAISATKSATTTASAYPNVNYTITAYWIENSTSMSNNTSQITVKATFKTGNANFDVSGAGKLYIDWWDNKNGWQTAKASKSINSCAFNTSYSCSATFNVEHKSDGSLSGYARARWDKLASSSYVPSDKNVSTDNKALTTIKRKATITSAPNFTDEDNPTISYSNPAGNSVTTLKAYIEDNSQNILVGLRDISKTGTSYPFNLTNEEREALRSYSSNSKTSTVKYVIMTTLGGNSYWDTSDKTLTIVNANPTIEQRQIIENNSNVISYLGSSSADTVVKNASNVTISVTPIAYKSATISSVVINHNGVNYTATESSGVYSATFDIVADTTTITTTDSRGNTVSEVWEPNVIEYQKVKQNSFSFKRVNPTSSNITFTLDSLYYQKTFGSTANVPTIKWKLDEGSWNTLSSSQYTIDTTNNKVTVNTTLNNAISYMNSGTFYVEVSDLLSTWTNSMNVTKGIPVFEYGEDDVQVNGDLYLCDTNRENKINVRDILVEKDFICCTLTSQQNITTTGEATVKFNSILAQRGSGFTFANNVVTCNFNGYVEVSGQIQFSNASNTNSHNIYIYQNSSMITRSLNAGYTNGSNKVGWVSPVIIRVSNGDKIKLNYYGYNGEYLNAVSNNTNMTIKKL